MIVKIIISIIRKSNKTKRWVQMQVSCDLSSADKLVCKSKSQKHVKSHFCPGVKRYLCALPLEYVQTSTLLVVFSIPRVGWFLPTLHRLPASQWISAKQVWPAGNCKTNYSSLKCLGCTQFVQEAWERDSKKEKSDHPSRRERPQLAQRKACVLFSVWLVKSSLFGLCCLHLIPPLIKLSTAVPLLPSFLWANLNLSIRSLEQRCLSTDLQCFSAMAPLYPAFSFNRNKADIFVGKLCEVLLGRFDKSHIMLKFPQNHFCLSSLVLFIKSTLAVWTQEQKNNLKKSKPGS